MTHSHGDSIVDVVVTSIDLVLFFLTPAGGPFLFFYPLEVEGIPSLQGAVGEFKTGLRDPSLGKVVLSLCYGTRCHLPRLATTLPHTATYPLESS